LTPSQLPDFPEYQGEHRSWEVSDGKGSDLEKSVKGGEATFYDDGSDTEDEVEIEKARAARVTVHTSDMGKKHTCRWFRYRKV
jgi:hypothetical protein